MRYNLDNIQAATYIGGGAWLAAVQYFIIQIIVTGAWFTPFSLRENFISDLGNTTCGIYAGNFVCSPLYALMNSSFIVYGITMIVGALVFAYVYRSSRVALIGLGLIALGGAGTILVGLFPEDTNMFLHQAGAFLGLGVGSVGVIVFGLGANQLPMWLRAATVLLGVTATLAFILFVSGVYGGFGPGGMERIGSYSFTVWMTLFGLIMLLLKKTTL